jgi:hypothetical protein
MTEGLAQKKRIRAGHKASATKMLNEVKHHRRHLKASDQEIHSMLYKNVPTVRAYHRLEFTNRPSSCIYCKLVLKKNKKSNLMCKVCNFSFCFKPGCDHFAEWHSSKCDPLRGFT